MVCMADYNTEIRHLPHLRFIGCPGGILYRYLSSGFCRYVIMLKKQPHRRSTVAIKRVIVQGNHYICGVCRKTYDDSVKANKCLEVCLGRHLNPDQPVVDMPGTGPKKYRCHFCRRVYTERSKAVECAAACRQHTQETVKHEHSGSAVAKELPRAGITAPPRSGSGPALTPAPAVPRKKPTVRRDQMHKFFRDGRKLVCRKCGAEKKTLDDVIACYDSHPAKEHTERPKKETPSPKPVAAAPKAESLSHEDEKFLRDGARYVCRNCNAKYFTRGDVIACFDGHKGVPAAKPAASQAAAPPAPDPAPAKSGPGLKNEDEKFFREGARYVCRICQKKHFTRGDVFACFDSHG